MLSMQNFHKSLFNTSARKDSYLNTLTMITQANKKELKTLASDLEWQYWGAATAEPENV